jgi:hypothetical protein
MRFSYHGELGGDRGAVTACLCRSCRRAQGFAAAVAPASRAGFTLTQGEDALVEFESSPGKLRAFCGKCGSPLYSRRTSDPDSLRLRLGAFDELPDTFRIDAVIHAERAPAWTRLESAPVFGGFEPGRPSDQRI